MENGRGEKNGINFGGPDGTRDPFVPSDNGDTDSSTSEEPEEFDECDCADDGHNRINQIPYVAVYEKMEAVRHRGYFIPGYPVVATIVKAERDQHGMHLISPYIYTIDLRHGLYQWSIKRRYVDFQRLHNNLSLYRAGARLTSGFSQASDGAFALEYMGGGDLIEPTKNGTQQPTLSKDNIVTEGGVVHYRKDLRDGVEIKKATVPPRRESRITETGELSGGGEDMRKRKKRQARHAKLPHFPFLPDSVIGEDGLEERKTQLQRYLSSALHVHAYRDHHETALFLEVGRLSFVQNLGNKYKEGLVKRRPGGNYSRSSCRNFCVTRCFAWRTSWLTIKDSFIAYVDPKDERIGDVFLFDRSFEVSTDADNTEETEGVKKGLYLSNMQRNLLLKCFSSDEAELWKRAVQKTINDKGKIWTIDHPHRSTFPPRQNVYAHWFVDGCSFMEQAANMMDIAKEEIFITDWWLNPQIYLKRPAKNDHWRLDTILKRKAAEGVRIFVLVYREIPQALALGSLQTEQYLTNLHTNIKVLRHPYHITAGVFVWAHHEKVIVVDQKIAFVGGIDLCYGRWDDHEHKLTDVAVIETCLHHDEKGKNDLEDIRKAYLESSSAPGSAAGSPRESPSNTRKLPPKENEEAAEQHPAASVNPAFDAQEPDLPNESDKKGFDFYKIVKAKQEQADLFTQNPIWLAKIKALRDRLAGETKELWIGKDYGNALVKDLPEPDKAFDDFVDRSTVPRMPWHDISSVVYGSVARDAGRHFIQRWNTAKADLARDRIDYPFLIPKSYENVGVADVFRRMATPCDVQVLRSSSLWSAGLKETESSIRNAYLKLISEAKHYIYIENQFFISQVGGSDVHNNIAQALFDRIVLAHKNNETFRVYILMPLLPAFLKASGAMQMVLHWTCTSVAKGPRSLLQNLKDTIGDYSEYITFCGLRTHDVLLGKLVTELVYIHSKIILVDDRFCVIGSANINDRSQMGNRDSEVAVLVEDTQFTPSTMNGQPYQSGTFVGSFRRRLFQEHLGLLHSNREEAKVHKLDIVDVSDPVSAEFYSTWNETAKRNTEIFDQVFKCPPSDELETLQQWAQREAQTTSMATTDKEAASKLLQGVRGHVVLFPTKFLSKSDLLRDKFAPEGLAPSYIFT